MPCRFSNLLFAIGENNTVIMLGVLQIILGQHRIARCLCVARQLHVLFGDMRRIAANFNVRSG